MATENFESVFNINTKNAEGSMRKLISVLKAFNNSESTAGIFKAVSAISLLNQVAASTPKKILLKFKVDATEILQAKNKIKANITELEKTPAKGQQKFLKEKFGLEQGGSAKENATAYAKINKEVSNIDHTLVNMYSSNKKINTELDKGNKGFGAMLGEAFSLEKVLSRIAFVSTAMFSWQVVRGFQQGLSDIVTQSIKFESSMASVFTLLDDNRQSYRKILSEEAIDIMQKYGESIETTTRALYDILSARIPPEWAGYVLDTAMMGAVAGFTDVKISGDALTTVLNSFNKEASEAGDVMDWFFQIIKYGKTTLEELQPNIGKVTSAASLLGISMEDVGASLATMTQAGVKTDIAITSLRQLFTTLSAPTDKAKEIFKKYNIELDVARVKKEGLGYAIKQLRGLTEEEIVTVAKSRRGFQALAVALGNNGRYLENYANIQKRGMAAFDAYIIRSQTLEYKLKQLKAAQTSLNLSVMGFVNNVGKFGVPIMTSFIKLLNKWYVMLPLIGTLVYALRGEFVKLGATIGKLLSPTTLAAFGSGGLIVVGLLAAGTAAMYFVERSKRATEEYNKWAEASYNKAKAQKKEEERQLSLLKSMSGLTEEEIKSLGIRKQLNSQYVNLISGTVAYNTAITELSGNIKTLTLREERLLRHRREAELDKTKKEIKDKSFEMGLSYRTDKRTEKPEIKASTDLLRLSTGDLAKKIKWSKASKEGDIERLDFAATKKERDEIFKKTEKFRKEIDETKDLSIESIEELVIILESYGDKIEAKGTKVALKYYNSIREMVKNYSELLDLKKIEQEIKDELDPEKPKKPDEVKNRHEILQEELSNLIKLWESYYGIKEKDLEYSKKIREKYQEIEIASQEDMIGKTQADQKEYENYMKRAESNIYEARKRFREKNLDNLKLSMNEEDIANKQFTRGDIAARKEYIAELKSYYNELKEIVNPSKAQRETKLSVLELLMGAKDPFSNMSGLEEFDNIVKKAKQGFKELRELGKINETTARALDIQDVIGSLSRTESGGDYKKVYKHKSGVEDKNAYGKYQFLPPTLKETLRTMGKTDLMDNPDLINKFLGDGELQEQVMVKWMNNILKALSDDGEIEESIGKTIKDVVITKAGLLAGAHLGGVEGVKKFVKSKGLYDPKDALGTSISDYIKKHGGVGEKTSYTYEDVLETYDALLSVAKSKEKTPDVLDKIMLEREKFEEDYLAGIKSFKDKIQVEISKAAATSDFQTKEQKAIAQTMKKYDSYLLQLDKLGISHEKEKSSIGDMIIQWKNLELQGIKLANAVIPSMTLSVEEFARAAKLKSLGKIGTTISDLFSAITGIGGVTKISDYDKLINQIETEAYNTGSIEKKSDGSVISKGSQGTKALNAIEKLKISKDAARKKAQIDAAMYLKNQLSKIWADYYAQQKAMVEKDFNDKTEKLKERAEAEHRSSVWLNREQEKLDSQREKELKKIAKREQTLAIAQAIINTSVAATKALGAGPFLGPFLAAMISGLGLIEVGMISSQKLKKGGIIGGKPHSQGGTTFTGTDGSVFEAERGELLAVVNKKSTDMLKYLSMINSMGGGIDFFKSKSPVMESGGIINPSMNRDVGVAGTNKLMNALINKIDKMEMQVNVYAKTLTDLDIVKKVRNGERRERRYS